MYVEIASSMNISDSWTVGVKVFDNVENGDREKIRQMQSAFRMLMQSGSEPRINHPRLPQPEVSSSDPRISLKQLDTMRKLLGENNISEKEFCKQHSVDKLEDMPKTDAIQTIGALIEAQKKSK